MFVNFTNHSSSKWSELQLREAETYGEILDIPFPSVDPECEKSYIYELANQYVHEITDKEPDCVLCQGEFCLSYAVIECLKAEKIKVVAACSRRVVEEISMATGTKKFQNLNLYNFVNISKNL